jgi:large subunit ribosomal protein L23
MAHKQDIIIKPLLTEKVVRYKDEQNKYAFVVAKAANKIEIKKAVEERFQVNVTKVNTMNYRGKLKRQGRFVGRRPSWKKAIVTLKEGDKIEVMEGI